MAKVPADRQGFEFVRLTLKASKSGKPSEARFARGCTAMNIRLYIAMTTFVKQICHFVTRYATL